jgi:tRNA A-37 threonylcarbamoyl transferase component Bud32
MANDMHKFIEPRVPTPAPGAERNKITGRLPDELLSEQIQRVAVFSAVAAGLWTFGLLMDTVVTPLTLGAVVPRIAVAIELLAIVTALVVFLYVRYASHCLQTKGESGLLFMVLNAVFIAMLNTWATAPTVETMGHLSWNTIVILISAMIVPATPRKMLAAAMIAASTDPLGVWIAHLRGIEVPSLVNTLVLFMPNYVCAVVATLPSHVLRHLGRRLNEAQAMGSYHLVELLGRGGMGEVWRAQHQLLARSAAIKLIRPEMLGASNSPEGRLALRRFEREAQATAALSSQHTIRVFDFGVTREGTFYYVMELLSGRDLESLVQEFGPVPADRAVYLLRQACHSLADAHARNLVHRDIKPANIYVCRMGLEYDFVKVLDFGLVKVSDKSTMQETMLTADHTTTGTPAFMAPEVITGQSDVDRRADVYALGCVAYYLLTGQLVFEADTPMKMFLQHVQTPPIPPSQRTELPIPRELDELVLSCLEKDPNKRPQDAEQLFQMACRASHGACWDNAMAKRWWEMHLLELTGPLALTDVRLETDTRFVVSH